MPGLFDGAESMEDIGEIYARIKANCPAPFSNSQKLWELRCACDISSHSENQETMLEKAVAMLAHNGYMRGWFNQCPTASGIGDSSRNRKSSVDLVHWDTVNERVRLVELKTTSNDPLYALREILRYGTAYVFCRIYKDKLHLQDRPLMKAKHVSLEVAAPACFYQNSHDLEDTLTRICEFLDKFDVGSRIDGLTMSLDALAFPEDFKLPFKNGEEVKQKCNPYSERLTAEGRIVRDAFNGLSSVV